MAKYAAALGALVASHGAAAALHTRVVHQLQYPPANFDVCHPQGTIVYGDTYPPCLSQGEIEGKCAPPTQDAAGWEFQRDCMCQGSFFEDAVGCSACKQCNAIQGHSESAHWNKVFDTIKANFCKKATPTSNFGGYWSSALAAVGSPVPTPGDKRDRCVPAGNTVVESYYVATKSQGPGLPRSTAANAEAKATTVAIVSGAKAEQQAAASAVATAVAVAGVSQVELHAAATARYGVAVVSGVPDAPGSPKYPLNATVNAEAKVEAKAEVHYALASLPCTVSFVGGFVRPFCGPFQLVANSSALVTSDSAKAGAVDFSRCVCAAAYLAPKHQHPIAGSASASASASVSAPAVNVFRPEECIDSCHVPAPIVKGEEKPTPSQPKETCVTSAPSRSGNEGSGGKPSSEQPSNKNSGEKGSGGNPSGGESSKGNGTPEEKAVSGSSPAKGDNGPAGVPGPGGAKGHEPNPAAPATVGTGAPIPPAEASGPVPIRNGAASAGVSVIALAIAFSVCAL